MKNPLVEFRKEFGLTHEEMAAALNAHISTYKKWVYGDRRIPPYIVRSCEMMRTIRSLEAQLVELRKERTE